MIRPATLADVEAIFSYAMHEVKMYEKLKPDTKKIHDGIIQSISSARHYCAVDVDASNTVNGVIIGLTSDNLWAQRKNCLIALWAAKKGGGAALLRSFKEWVQSRRAIKVAGIVPDSNHVDSRAYLLAERIGFKKYGGTYLLYN